MNACCKARDDRKRPKRNVRRSLAWLLPSSLLMVVPKCPACVAAYVTLWTGVGVSLSTATYLRWTMLLVGFAALLLLIVQRLDLVRILNTYFKKVTQSCNTL